jgi:hypothetical protein
MRRAPINLLQFSESSEQRSGPERDDVPIFNINFIPSRPEGMVACRLTTGHAGYILRERVAEFREFSASVRDAM